MVHRIKVFIIFKFSLTSKRINILKQGKIFNFQNENRNQIIYG